MKTKHTQGIWAIEFTPNYYQPEASRIEISTKNGKGWICKVQNNGIIEQEEGLANAQLIASAPELLDALQYLLNCNTKDRFKCELQDAINKAEASIKKAIGE